MHAPRRDGVRPWNSTLRRRAMNRQVDNLGAVTVVTIQTNSLDASNAHEFKRLIKDLQEIAPRVVLDLSWVTFLDSCGCGALLTAMRCLDQVGGHVAICGLSQRARDSLGL